MKVVRYLFRFDTIMIRSRIAPTPSGYLHIGNALNFVTTWLMVRRAGGSLRLRIDDIDVPRARPEYVEDIFRTLEWMGMDYDEGPQTPDEHARLYSQALRGERYDKLIRQLIQSGRVFACECSRKEISEQGCRCKDKSLDLATPDTALRIATTDESIQVNDERMGRQMINLNKEMKDFAIRRRDGIAAYQVASLADDIDYGINLIVRGEDLLHSTAAQLYLALLIGADDFMQTSFHHHPLLNDEHGHKLSKSTGSFSLKAMREVDGTPDKLYKFLSEAMDIPTTCYTLPKMLEALK